MSKAHQQCRVCGIEIPSGFTHCDICYDKIGATKEKNAKPPRFNNLKNPA